MNAVIYYLSIPFIYFISWLPFPVMYLISDLIHFILFRIIGYRKQVIITNLTNSFPEKNIDEIQEISRKFNRYFCDLMLETLKTLTISRSSVKKCVEFEDDGLFEKFYNKNQSVVIVMGHLGNWELAGARFALEKWHELYVIYHPLSNKYFDQLIYHMRTRLGNRLYAMNETARGMIANRNNITATAFIADQSPRPESAHWMTFLNQETPVFTGTSKLSQKLNYPIIYASVKLISRGKYAVKCELLTENPQDLTEDQITELHTKRLEADIIEQPEIWLWSHRRWKHRRKENIQ